MKRKRILLVDSSSILHTVKHSGIKHLRNKDKPTYIMFGFMLKLQQLMNNTKSDVTVFACDSKLEDSVRKKIYPSYKEKRNSKEKPQKELDLDAVAYPQFDTVENYMLPKIGYNNIFTTKGLEADDIIGRICKTYSACEIIIVTTDKDMYQLLTDTVCVINPKNMQYFTKSKFIKAYGVVPKMWKRVKAIGGCSSDEVKGVPGVAEKTALKYIKGELPAHHKTFQRIRSPEGKRIINRNKSLVILPFRRTPEYEIKEDRISKIKLHNVAKEFGFMSIITDIENWVKILKGWS